MGQSFSIIKNLIIQPDNSPTPPPVYVLPYNLPPNLLSSSTIYTLPQPSAPPLSELNDIPPDGTLKLERQNATKSLHP